MGSRDMQYQASLNLTNLVNDFKKGLIINFFFSMIIGIGFSFLIYFNVGKNALMPYCIGEVIIFISMGLIQYGQIVPKGNVIAKTANEVTVTESELIVKTMPFSVFFWINKPSKELIFNLTETRLKTIPFPVKQIFDLDDGNVFKFSDSQKEVIVLVVFFDKELEQKIKQMLY